MRETWKRVTSCLLLICLLLSALVGCKPKKANDGYEKKDLNEALYLLENCVIIYPDGVAPSLFDRVLKLQSDIRSATGMELSLSNDYPVEDKDRMEILIGNTARQESREVMDDLAFFGYTVRSVGNKVVIAAHTSELLFAAMESFVTRMLFTDGTGFLIGEDYTEDATEIGFFEKYGDVEKYRIVYPAAEQGLQKSAQTLADALQKKYKVELPVVTDDEAPNGYEILIGSTNRALFADYYRGDAKPDALHFAICAREGNLMLMGGSERANEIAVSRFLVRYADLMWSDRLDLPADLALTLAAYDYEDPYAERSEGTDVRIMSYNVLSKELSPDAADFEERAELVLSTVLNYMPDVVGLQEVSEKAYGIIERMIGEEYAITEKKTPNGAFSYTTMMYNRKTVRYVEGGNHVYTVGNKRIRIFSWGLFEKLDTGERFVAASTHWDIVLDQRPQQAAQMTELVNEMKARYACPVFTTGDFNTLDKVGYYQSYLKDSGQADARYVASVSGITPKDEVIDHITATVANTVALFYQYFDTELAKIASDHRPVIADYQFK